MVVRVMCEEGERLADLHEFKLFGQFRECTKEQEHIIYGSKNEKEDQK